MKNFKSIIFSLFLFSLASNLLGQGKVDYLQIADKYFQEKNYFAAYDFYKKVLDDIPDSSYKIFPYVEGSALNKPRLYNEYREVVYKLGESARLFFDYANAEIWYEKAQALNQNNEMPLVDLYLGQAQRANGKYADAIKNLDKFIKAKSADSKFIDLAKTEKESCKYALRESAAPRLIQIEKLDTTSINIPGVAHYATFIVDQDSQMIFSSTRQKIVINKKIKKDFANRILKSNNIDNTWTSPEFYGVPFKKNFDHAALSLNAKGDIAYFTMWSTKAKDKTTAIYLSRLKEGVWQKPEKLNDNVNGKKVVSMQGSVSGNTLFFSSNRIGTFGGMDIWYASLDSTGQPLEAVNAGFNVNTIFDEQSPVYSETNQTLYFSSNGLIGMGGQDNYFSKGSPGNFSKAKNFGLGINSSKDDMYYFPSSDPLTKGFFSSDRTSYCCLEIFSFERLNYAIRGKVVEETGRYGVPEAKVVLKDRKTQEVLDSALTDNQGNYFFDIYYRRDYGVKASKEGFFSDELSFNTFNVSKSDTLKVRDLRLVGFKLDQAFLIKNIFYDFDKATLRPESMKSLDSLYGVLVNNPELIVEIGSHTDSKGSEEYNANLSLERAKSVVDYLISKGISKEVLLSKGYGEIDPVAPNENPDGSDNPEGRQLNRRTEFKVKAIKN